MESSESDRFVPDLESVKDDINTMEKLYKRLQEANEQCKTIRGAADTKKFQALMDSDIDDVYTLAEAIWKRLEAPERSNISNDRKVSGSETFIDGNKTSEVMGLGKKLKEMMDGFEALRVKIVGVHKEAIESIYYSITKEKESVETIEKIVSKGEIEAFLMVAREEQGSVRILDVVQEIQERINGAKYVQKSLLDLHKLFLDIVALLEPQGCKLGSNDVGLVRGKPSVKRGEGQVVKEPENHVRSEKKRATVALIVVVVLVILIVALFLLRREKQRE